MLASGNIKLNGQLNGARYILTINWVRPLFWAPFSLLSLLPGRLPTIQQEKQMKLSVFDDDTHAIYENWLSSGF